jgi:hypothetical protein
MPKYQCRVENPSVHGVTGHHTVEVYILEFADDGTTVVDHGIMEKYGIDIDALDLLYAGDVKKWLAKIANEMLEKHQRRRRVQASLNALLGSELDIKDL